MVLHLCGAAIQAIFGRCPQNSVQNAYWTSAEPAMSHSDSEHPVDNFLYGCAHVCTKSMSSPKDWGRCGAIAGWHEIQQSSVTITRYCSLHPFVSMPQGSSRLDWTLNQSFALKTKRLCHYKWGQATPSNWGQATPSISHSCFASLSQQFASVCSCFCQSSIRGSDYVCSIVCSYPPFGQNWRSCETQWSPHSAHSAHLHLLECQHVLEDFVGSH